jgi:hypothetical protein
MNSRGTGQKRVEQTHASHYRKRASETNLARVPRRGSVIERRVDRGASYPGINAPHHESTSKRLRHPVRDTAMHSKRSPHVGTECITDRMSMNYEMIECGD